MSKLASNFLNSLNSVRQSPESTSLCAAVDTANQLRSIARAIVVAAQIEQETALLLIKHQKESI